MKRKIIKQGHNTLTLTLPSKWAENFNIKAGDEIELIEQGKDLKISTDKKTDGSQRAVIDITGMTVPMVWRLVSSVYRRGYDEVKITFEDKSFRDVYTAFTYNTIQTLSNDKENELSPLEAIQALVNRFIGFEIIEQKSNYCVIKDLSQTSSKEFDNTLRRIFLLIQTMSDAIVEAAKKGNKEGLKGVHIIDTNLDRFQDFCLRILNKEGYSDFKNTPNMYTLIFILELLGDEYKRVGLHLLHLKKLNKEVIDYIIDTDNLFKKYYHLYYNYSDRAADEIYQIDKKRDVSAKAVLPHLNHEEAEIMHHLKKIGRFIISTTELRIDLNY
jgi:phosphate uptake regulator